MIKYLCLAGLVNLMAVPVFATQDSTTLIESLVGRWAQDCSHLPTTANPYVEFSTHDGHLLRTAFTDHETATYPVRAISFESGTIHLIFGSTNEDTVTISADYDPGVSMQTIDAFVDRSGQSRQYGIKNRQQLNNHKQSVKVYKCSAVAS